MDTGDVIDSGQGREQQRENKKHNDFLFFFKDFHLLYILYDIRSYDYVLGEYNIRVLVSRIILRLIWM